MLNFRDMKVFIEDRVSIGIEESSNKYFLSFPVSNGMVEYSEYFEISEEEFKKFMTTGLAETRDLVERCKQRKCDDRLMMKPGKNRGFPI